jgi:hypothetical protein
MSLDSAAENVLHDFMTLTKGQEYLLAVGAMVVFTIFWMILDRSKRKKRKRRRSPQDD